MLTESSSAVASGTAPSPMVTRFAPSPTGFLHIGGARTALFNRLLAQHHGGRFLLRIEDTDRARSTPEAIAAILDGLSWMGLRWDDDPLYQSERAARHRAVALDLLDKGLAYRCYASPEELEAMRAEQRAAGKPVGYDGRWRDRDLAEAPAGVDPVIRLRAPRDGETVLEDLVQGSVTVANAQLDDMVLLRADGTPTYMLAVVVDDHDMGVTHVIRGDDHLTNAFRQVQIFKALGWPVPTYGHIPLIHGADGKKLSKRHGALGIDAYRDMGFLPEALRNYLLRLGWGHGNDEIISDHEAVRLFDGSGIGKAPARLDLNKLTAVNAHYLRELPDAELTARMLPFLRQEVSAPQLDLLTRAIPGLKPRCRTLIDLAENAAFYVKPRPLALNEKALAILQKDDGEALRFVQDLLSVHADWTSDQLEATCRAAAEAKGISLGALAQPVRAAVSGSTVSPPVFEVLALLGRAESLARIEDALAGLASP